ncbi:MAG TPA: deoxyhypusine synthase family protein [Blastocatellia bacterium]|nr:deoxyhypusine synthase family protein [Blastocatellia bacterium]
MMRKPKSAKYLTNPTRPVQIDRDRSVAGILTKMEGAGFQARTLADAHNLWLDMLSDNSTILMGLSGALVAGGMRRLISYLIKNHFVDVVVSTGNNLFQDLHETLGRYHYQATPDMTDEELQEAQVGRFHDMLASEHEYREADEWVGNFANTLDHSRPYSTREFLHLLGRELAEIATEDGILTSAYKAKVPVFCPCVADSAIAVGIAISRINRKNPFQFDIIQDVVDASTIIARSVSTSVVMFGGGSPRSFLHQTEVGASILKQSVRGHKYALQIGLDLPESSVTSNRSFAEAQTWGRVAKDAKTISVLCDPTIAMPVLVTALSQTGTKPLKQRRRPQFNFGRELTVTPG